MSQLPTGSAGAIAGKVHKDDATSPGGASNAHQFVRSVLQVGSRLLVLLVIFGVFGLLVPNWAFFKAGNIENILLQSAVYAMGALGMTMVIITGGIDLAAGSIIAFATVVTVLTMGMNDGQLLRNHPVLWTTVSAAAGILSGGFIGLLQGSMITGLRLVPFIVTLGGYQWVRGLAKTTAQGFANKTIIDGPPNWLYDNLMYPIQGKVFNWHLFPLGVWATLIAALFAGGLLKYTKLGRRIYAVGSNEATARLCGIPVQRTKIAVYTLAGVFAGMAGILEFSKLNLGDAGGAMSVELYIIASCVIGGTSLLGGVGTISGSVIGAILISTLFAGLAQMGMPKQVQEMSIGVIIIVAAALDTIRNWKRD